MIKKLLLLLVISIFVTFENYAQDAVTPAASKEISTASLRNAEITIDNQVFDYRILKHYSESELRNMPSVKRKKLHFLYTSSYIITNQNSCNNVSMKDIDVSKIEVLRKDNLPNTVIYLVGECKVSVQLISLNELNQQLNNIK